MSPGSTTKKNGKVYRFYRCSTRDKYGKEKCAARPLPAAALEAFVVAHITAAIADGALVARVEEHLTRLIRVEPENLASRRKALVAQVADASVAASKLTEQLIRLEGRARELVEAKLQVQASKLAHAESQLKALESDVANQAELAEQREWLVNSLRDFAKVWKNMTPENQGRFLRALVAEVRVNEATGVCQIELIDFGAAAERRDAA